ncbi:MAG: hypothetical protein RLZZ81_822 [Pseudomonadota bacterium]|jgi:hypothetical protein
MYEACLSDLNNTKKLAVIITAQYDSEGVFSKDKGYYRANKQLLIDNNYQVIEIDNISNQEEIKEKLSSVSSQLDFFWIRGHGAPKAIQLSATNNISSKEITDKFSWLSERLNDNAIIYLDSCNTGNIEQDFYNNIQFSFAKATLEKPNIKIAAPSKVSHISFFEIKNNEFKFFSNHGYGKKNDIVVLGTDTKKLLKDLDNQNEKLLECKKQLLDTLITDKEEVTFYDSLYKNYLEECNLVISKAFKKAVLAKDLNATRQLIEKFKLNVNSPLDKKFSSDYIPLCWAFDSKSPDILKEILEGGADLFSYTGKLSLNYLMQKSYNSNDIFYFNTWSMLEKHLMQNQPSDLKEFYNMRTNYMFYKTPIIGNNEYITDSVF